MKNSFQIGTRVKAFGEIKRGRFMAEIHHPEYQIIRDNAPLVLEETLTPIYSTTEGLKQNSLRKLTDQALALLDKIQLTEILPLHFSFLYTLFFLLLFLAMLYGYKAHQQKALQVYNLLY